MANGIGDNFLASIKSQVDLAKFNSNNPANIKAGANNPEQAAAEFESLLVQQMMKSMWQSVPKEGLLSGGHEEEIYQEMLQKEVANHIAEHQSFGIRDMVLREMEARGDIPKNDTE